MSSEVSAYDGCAVDNDGKQTKAGWRLYPLESRVMAIFDHSTRCNYRSRSERTYGRAPPGYRFSVRSMMCGMSGHAMPLNAAMIRFVRRLR
jgi:hypothetical protein